MSEDQLKAFLEKVKSDTELQEKIKSVTSPEAAIEIAKDAGFSITSEDIQSMKSKSPEVSDQELEGAAGGTAAALVALGVVAAIPIITEHICDQ
ncbi:Nif11-like leader peptide family natural product precursor [Synechococcus sp. UW179A]|uniref:Nif11-like leader peptide family natural product precursor n=1 Tax=Synechococcus sp. UW179A TaxID=2575510 RepID=UPI000E0FD939|nr:Nif11-like leader peptide family natural product precursor [Synechococcus sp. UW179A]